MDARKKTQNNFQNPNSSLSAHRRWLGLRWCLTLLIARTGVGICLLAGFFLAHVVAHGATDCGTGNTVLACNVAGNAPYYCALQAACVRDGGHRCQRHQQGQGK